MHTTCVNSKDNAKSNDSDHIFVIRENMHLKHRCPSSMQTVYTWYLIGHLNLGLHTLMFALVPLKGH